MDLPVANKPEDIGIDSEKLEAVFARAKRDVDDGVLPSAQVAVARQGKLAGVRTYGVARHGESEAPATNDTLYTIFSSTKAIIAVGRLDAVRRWLAEARRARVRTSFPSSARTAKRSSRSNRRCSTSAAFPMAPFGALDWDNRERRLQRFSTWRLNWEPGSQFVYHATSAHWVLAEIIERRTGKDFRAYVRERILDPMGLADFYVGLPSDENGRVADVYHVDPPVPPPGGWGEVTPDAILSFNRPEVRAVGVPGGGGITTAAGLAMFYQPLINGGATAGGTRIMKAETIEWATQVRTKDFHREQILDYPINRALAVVVAGDDGYQAFRGFGKTTRRVPLAMAGPVARSRGVTPRRAFRLATARTALLATCSRAAASRQFPALRAAARHRFRTCGLASSCSRLEVQRGEDYLRHRDVGSVVVLDWLVVCWHGALEHGRGAAQDCVRG